MYPAYAGEGTRLRSGFGPGAVSTDAVYGLIAALGLTFVSNFLMEGEAWLRTPGGAFLAALGVKFLLERPAEHAVSTARESGLFGAYASTFLLTLANPATILSFAAIFAAAAPDGAFGDSALLVLGIFLGSAAWWLLLSGGVGLFHASLGPRSLQ